MRRSNVSTSFWKGKRVFLTGHTGFKGAWLSLWLREMGAHVFGYSLEPTARSLFEAAELESLVKHRIGDIRNVGDLTDAMLQANPDVVMHFAAQSLVRPSYADPLGTFATNVMGTAHVLEAVRCVARQCPSPPAGQFRAVVIVTTDKCYQNNEWVWGYRESDALGGHDPYSSSKACAEIVSASYRKAFAHEFAGTALATARAGNVIGGGDWSEDRLVPDAVTAFASGQHLKIRNPNAIRPWQHVLEPLAGYLMLAERLAGYGHKFAEAWNFGPESDSERSVQDVISILSGQWGEGAVWGLDEKPVLHEAQYLKLDSSKAKSALGWQGRLRLEEAISLTVDWYKRHQTGTSARDLTCDQIRAYMAA
jgi:CDP-glucose 4,6-dehydratase